MRSMDTVLTGCGNSILENSGVLNGGCGEGTIFTFTSGHKPGADNVKENSVSGRQGHEISVATYDGAAQSQDSFATPLGVGLAAGRFHCRRSKSPCKIRIDFKELLAENGTKGSKMRGNLSEDSASALGQNGLSLDRRKLDWNDKAKQLAELFDSRKHATLGIQKRGKMHVFQGAIALGRAKLSIAEDVAGKDQLDATLIEMASRIREQEACRENLTRENALLREQLERLSSGELRRQSSSAREQADESARATERVSINAAEHQTHRNRSRKEKLRRSKSDSTDDRKNRLGIKLVGEKSLMMDKRRSMKAWLRSGYFDFSGAPRHGSPLARSFISFKAGLSSVGRKPYILKFKRKEEGGLKGSKFMSRNKENCNGYAGAISDDLTAWTEEPPSKAPSSPPKVCIKRLKRDKFSSHVEKYVEDNSIKSKSIFRTSHDCEGEVTPGGVHNAGHCELINRTIADITSLFQEEQSQKEKLLELQSEEHVHLQVAEDGGVDERDLAEENQCPLDVEELPCGKPPQERQELQISAWVTELLASVEQKLAHTSLEHDEVDGKQCESNSGAWERFYSEAEPAPKNSVAEPDRGTAGLQPQQDSKVPEMVTVKDDRACSEKVFNCEETGADLDESGLQTPATGIKAMLKDFHMKERLTRLRRMPVLFRSKKSSAYSWLRLSHDNKSVMLQQVASNDILRKEVLFVDKQGKDCGLRSDGTDLSGFGVSEESPAAHCNPQPLEEYLPVKKAPEEGGIRKTCQSLEEGTPQGGNGYPFTGEGALCASVASCKHQEPLESGQIVSCCSGFGSFGREKVYAVEDDQTESVQPISRCGTNPMNGITERQEGSRSIFGKSKMRGILGFRKEKDQVAASHGYSYTSLSLIVGKENKNGRNSRKTRSSVDKIKLQHCDSSADEGRLSDVPFTGDADSQHDSAQEDEAGLSNPVSLGNTCPALYTKERPPTSPSFDHGAKPRSTLHDALENGTDDSVELQPTGSTESTNTYGLLFKDIAPAEQVFLAKFSAMAVDDSRQSANSVDTDRYACKPAPEPSISDLTSLLLPSTPLRRVEAPTWSETSPHSFGIRCSTAPCPSQAKEDGTIHQPIHVPARPTTASGDCLQGSKSSLRTYNPSPYSPTAVTLDPVVNDRGGHHLCPQVQGASFPVCSSSIQRHDYESYPCPESCGTALSTIPDQSPHLLAHQQQPHFGYLWGNSNQHHGEHAAGRSHLLDHSCEPHVNPCLSEASLIHNQDKALGYVPKNSSGWRLQSAWTTHQPELRTESASSDMFVNPRSRQAYKMNLESQLRISRPHDNTSELSLCHHPLIVPSVTPPTAYNQQIISKRLQPSLNQESAYLLRKQCQVGQTATSLQSQYRAAELLGAFPVTVGSDTPPAPSTISLHEPKDEAAPSSGNLGQHVLWLSEEETEIIRQIRVSKEKGHGPSLCTSLSTQQATKARPDGPDNNEVASFYHRRAVSHCSNLSSCSADDSHFDDGRSLKDSDANWRKATEYDNQRGPIENKRQLAMLDKMVIAACRNSAATCIQKWWKKCLHQKAVDLEQYHAAALKLSKIPGWLHQFPDVKLRTTTTISRVTQRRKWVLRMYTSLQRAAITIQRWWRNLSRHKRQIAASSRKLPNTIKGLYNLVKSRHLSRGVIAPTHDRFLKLVERVQAATEGARVRGRLRSRRLQAMIMEIKEIRALLLEISLDNSRETPPNFVPQLYNQLQQKLLQLRTALTGPERDARFLLRRSPASPLVIVTTRPTRSFPGGAAGQRSGDQALLKSSSGSLADTLNAANYQSVGGNDKSNVFALPKKSQISPRLPEQNNLEVTYRLGGRKRVEAGYARVYQQTNGSAPPPHKRADEELQRFSQTESAMHEIQFQMSSSAGSEEQFYEMEYVEDPNRPKRPYLKRKSVMMAPQKLDWSKVKPMVRSRLEPELRTKMTQNNKSTRLNVSSTARTITKNYSKVKSRLFNYEQKGSSAESSTSKGAAGDAEMSTLAEARQISESRRAEREHGEALKSGDRMKKARNDSVHRPSDSLVAVSTGVPAKSSSEPPAASIVDGGAKKKVEEKVITSRQHSNRYGSLGYASQSKTESSVVHQNPTKETAKPLAEAAASKQGWVASVELENMLKGVMALKNEKGLNLSGLFQPSQGKSVVPRLHPSACILNTSVEERNMLFDALWNEGRGGQG